MTIFEELTGLLKEKGNKLEAHAYMNNESVGHITAYDLYKDDAIALIDTCRKMFRNCHIDFHVNDSESIGW